MDVAAASAISVLEPDARKRRRRNVRSNVLTEQLRMRWLFAVWVGADPVDNRDAADVSPTPLEGIGTTYPRMFTIQIPAKVSRR